MAVPPLQELALHVLVNNPQHIQDQYIPTFILNELMRRALLEDKLDDAFLRVFRHRALGDQHQTSELYRVTRLSLRFCDSVTDLGLLFALQHPLTELDLSGCQNLGTFDYVLRYAKHSLSPPSLSSLPAHWHFFTFPVVHIYAEF
jgi:hypothetical protein